MWGGDSPLSRGLRGLAGPDGEQPHQTVSEPGFCLTHLLPGFSWRPVASFLGILRAVILHLILMCQFCQGVGVCLEISLKQDAFVFSFFRQK